MFIVSGLALLTAGTIIIAIAASLSVSMSFAMSQVQSAFTSAINDIMMDYFKELAWTFFQEHMLPF